MKLIVVGAGVAGTWLANRALARGHEVSVVADPNSTPASAAALVLMRPSWLPRDERPLLRRSVELYRAAGIECYDGALVSRWDREGTVEQDDWRAVAPCHPSLEGAKLVERIAQPLGPTAVWMTSRELIGDAVVWCDGGRTLPGSRTYGSTWVHEDPDALAFIGEPLAPSVRVHHVAPYKSLGAVRYEDSARLGSSSASSLPKALSQADEMLDKAIELGWTASRRGWRRLDGVRFRRPAGAELLTYSQDSGWHWSGFHRNGYALAPALADDVLDAVEVAA